MRRPALELAPGFRAMAGPWVRPRGRSLPFTLALPVAPAAAVTVVLAILLAAATGVGAPAVALGASLVRAGDWTAPAQAVLQLAAADLNGDGRDELVVLGRQYEAQEVRVYVMGWPKGEADDGPPSLLATGPNLYESASHVVMAVGSFRGSRPEVLVLTRSRARLLRFQSGKLSVVWEKPYDGDPGEAAAFLPRPSTRSDARSTTAWLAVTEAVGVRDGGLQKRIALYEWAEAGLVERGASAPVGSVRSLAAGDLTGDGAWEIAVEHGVGNEVGTVEVWRWDGQSLRRVDRKANLREAPVFGMTVAPIGEGGNPELVLADDQGRLSTYAWTSGGLRSQQVSVGLGWGMAAVTAGRFDATGEWRLVAAQHPNVLHLVLRR